MIALLPTLISSNATKSVLLRYANQYKFKPDELYVQVRDVSLTWLGPQRISDLSVTSLEDGSKVFKIPIIESEDSLYVFVKDMRELLTLKRKQS